MQVQVNKIINDYLEAKNAGVVSYLYQAPTKEGTYIVLTDISDRSILTKDQGNINQSKSRMQLSIFTSDHAQLKSLKKVLQDCIRTTKDQTQDDVTWLMARDNFSESIYNKQTNRHQCVIDFFIDYLEPPTT